MQHTNESRQRHVLGDWGTSRLRLSLVENNAIKDSREGQGIGTLTAAPADTLAALVASWTDAAQPLEVVLSGMVGSRNGLFEVPYATLPADCAQWSRFAWSTQMRGMNITIATGLRGGGDGSAFDVMRGEETQIFGAIRLDAALAAGSHLFVLPGTHSKWVEVENGRIVRFRTAFSGELYGLLRDHSTLLKAGAVGSDPAADTEAGFTTGLSRCNQLTEGLLAALFEARTAQLLQYRSRGWASGFLSGLLIGYEIATMSPTYSRDGGVKIIADTNLSSLYRRVFVERGVQAHVLDGAACAVAGLRCLRECLGRN